MSPKTPLLRPREYFESRPTPIGSGLGVYALYLVGTAVFIYALVQLLVAQIENLPPEGERALSRAFSELFGTFVIFFILLAVVAILVVAAIMHFLSKGSGVDGTFTDAIAVAGWSYAPEVLGLPIKYLLAWRQVSGLALDGSDPQALAAQFETVEASTGLVDGLLEVLIVGWSVYILALGIAGTHDADVDRTIWPALLVGAGALLLRLT